MGGRIAKHEQIEKYKQTYPNILRLQYKKNYANTDSLNNNEIKSVLITLINIYINIPHSLFREDYHKLYYKICEQKCFANLILNPCFGDTSF